MLIQDVYLRVTHDTANFKFQARKLLFNYNYERIIQIFLTIATKLLHYFSNTNKKVSF